MKLVSTLETVAVLYSGASAERKASLGTTAFVVDALTKLNIPHKKIELSGNWVQSLQKLNPVFAFITGHGKLSEDGTLQGVLESLNIPYNGSGVLASAVAMNKPMAKKLFMCAGLDVPEEVVFNSSNVPVSFDEIGMSFPVVVKPASGGSSCGVSIVKNIKQWESAISNAKSFCDSILVEEFISGLELTVGIMGGKAIGVTEIISNKGEFYTSQAKYDEGGSTHITPAEIEEEVYARALQWAQVASNTLGCSGAVRVDMLYDEKADRLVVLEVNTLPGMTNTSLLPEIAEQAGYSFTSLIEWMMEDGKCLNTKAA